MSRLRVKVSDGVVLAVDVHEGDTAAKPTVVLVHGYPDTSRVWEGVVARLSSRYRVVTYDVRGAGSSTAPGATSGYRLDRLADDLHAVLDRVSPDAPAHVVGHDWGAMQLFESATDPGRSQRLASFTAISGPSLDHVGHWVRARLRLTTRPLRNLAALWSQAPKSWYLYGFQLPAIPEQVIRSGLGERLRNLLEPGEGGEGYPAATFEQDAVNGIGMYRANVDRLIRPRRDHVYVPLQVVVGNRDPFVSAELFDDLATFAPEAWLRVVHGRHWLPLHQPDLVARVIGELVDHVESGVSNPEFERAALDRHKAHLPLHGKVVVVTGAGNGIGRATAIAFAEQGADVAVVDIDRAAAERTARFASHVGATTSVHVVDVADVAAMGQLAKDVLAEHGVADIVVNNAGIGMAGPFLDTTIEDWDRVLAVNLWGVIHGCRQFARQMVEAGRPGQIVNVASAAAYTPARDLSAYATTKAAVLMLSETLRGELAEDGIGVTAICPGVVDSGITSRARFVGVDDGEQARRRRATSALYQRRGFGPEKVAQAIVRAVRRDRAVVPVTPEAHVIRLLSRASPGLLRLLARIQVVGR